MALPVIGGGAAAFRRIGALSPPPFFRGGGGGNMAKRIQSQLSAAQARANQANEQRFQRALAESRAAADRMRAQFGAARASLAQVGKTAEADIGRGAERSLAQQQQALIGSGLAGTTIQSAVARGVEEDRTRAMGRVQEGRQTALAGLATQQAGFEAQAGRDLTGLMAAKSDRGPDLGMFAGLLQQAGQSGGPRRFGGVRMSANAAAGRSAFGTPSRYFGRSRSRRAATPSPQAEFHTQPQLAAKYNNFR